MAENSVLTRDVSAMAETGFNPATAMPAAGPVDGKISYIIVLHIFFQLPPRRARGVRRAGAAEYGPSVMIVATGTDSSHVGHRK
jgi:hypothetical protein